MNVPVVAAIVAVRFQCSTSARLMIVMLATNSVGHVR